jgi:hypothetical protein
VTEALTALLWTTVAVVGALGTLSLLGCSAVLVIVLRDLWSAR